MGVQQARFVGPVVRRMDFRWLHAGHIRNGEGVDRVLAHLDRSGRCWCSTPPHSGILPIRRAVHHIRRIRSVGLYRVDTTPRE